MQIALTGGSGGVGRAITALALAQGHTIVSIDRALPKEKTPEGVRFVKADITDYDDLENAMRGSDALIHMAAIPTPHNNPDYVVHNNNVVGSYNALSIAAKLGIRRVCQASSVNAIGLQYSRGPVYDYFPIDEQHRTRNEDPYSLSKWICEEQADSFARRYEEIVIASMRFHWVVADREYAAAHRKPLELEFSKNLWGYTRFDAAASACLLSLTAVFSGHEVFCIVAPDTMMDVPSLELKEEFFPNVELRGDLNGNNSFYNSTKAERLLHWKHPRGS